MTRTGSNLSPRLYRIQRLSDQNLSCTADAAGDELVDRL